MSSSLHLLLLTSQTERKCNAPRFYERAAAPGPIMCTCLNAAAGEETTLPATKYEFRESYPQLKSSSHHLHLLPTATHVVLSLKVSLSRCRRLNCIPLSLSLYLHINIFEGVQEKLNALHHTFSPIQPSTTKQWKTRMLSKLGKVFIPFQWRISSFHPPSTYISLTMLTDYTNIFKSRRTQRKHSQSTKPVKDTDLWDKVNPYINFC